MTSVDLRVGPRPVAVLLLAVAVAAWVSTAVVARRVGRMPGTMELSLLGFLPVWALMMAAMMVPSVVPVASLYVRTFQSRRYQRVGAFAAGYLLVWVAVGVPAYGLATVADGLTRDHPTGATVMAAALLAAAGIYQLTPLKERCLVRCRSPLALLFRYASFRGRLRDVRAGLHHAAVCVACCLTLMALLVAFGLMNVPAMLGLAGVVLLEKVAPRGRLVARLTGAGALVVAVVVLWEPQLAPGLHATM